MSLTFNSFFRLDRYRRFSGAAVGLMDQGFVSAVNFLVVVLLARTLPLAQFGVFMLAQMLLIFCTTLQSAAIAQPHNILGAQREGVAYLRLTYVLAITQLLIAATMATLAALVGWALWLYGNSDYAAVAFALAIIILPWTSQEFIRRVLYTQGEVHSAAVNNLVSYGLQLAAIGLLIRQAGGMHFSPSMALLALGFAAAIATVIGILQLRRHISAHQFSLLPERHSWRAFITTFGESWHLSKWLVAQQSVTWLGASGHGWILAALLGPASFGVYRAGYQIVNILNPLRQAAMNHLPSRAARTLSHAGVAGLHRWYKRTTWQLILPFTLCALLVVIGTEPIAQLFYNQQVPIPNVHVIVALGALTFVLNFARTPLDYAVLVGGGARQLFLRALWLAGLVLTLGATLIWSVGITGAMISEVITAIVALLVTLRVYRVSVYGLRTRQAERSDVPCFTAVAQVSKP